MAETTQPYPSAIRATTGPLTAGIFIGLPQSPIDGLVLENVTVHEANPVDNPYRMVGWNCAQPRSIGHCTQRADTCFCFLNRRSRTHSLYLYPLGSHNMLCGCQ